MTKQTKLIILASLFVGTMLITNAVSAKLFTVFNVVLSAGIIAYPMTFLITDTVGEVWGKREARTIIYVGFVMNVLFVVAAYIAISLPAASFWDGQEAMQETLGAVPRIVLASMIAYLVSQTNDTFIFHKLKEWHKDKLLFVRNNVSTAVSQLIDACIFYSIAFYGIMPIKHMFIAAGSSYLIKLAIAAADTPFCYITVRWAKNG